MPGTVLEHALARTLYFQVAFLCFSLFLGILISSLIPKHSTSEALHVTTCMDTSPNSSEWITPQCEQIDLKMLESEYGISAKEIVFVVEMPSNGSKFYKWQRNLAGSLQIDMVFYSSNVLDLIDVTVDARLAYSDKTGKGRTTWNLYTHAQVKKYMDCTQDKNLEGYVYNCSITPLFDLGSLFHDYYLLNLRLPYRKLIDNVNVEKIQDMQLHTKYLDVVFSQVAVWFKLGYIPPILQLTMQFFQRLKRVPRAPVLLEYMLMALASALVVFDFPIELLITSFDVPYMSLINDIRQVIFYSSLLSFWLVLAGEDMLVQNQKVKITLKLYQKHLISIAVGCLSLLIFSMWEHGKRLVSPFYSMYDTQGSTTFVKFFVIILGILASLYLILLCYKMWGIFRDFNKKQAVLPTLLQGCSNIHCRFIALMVAILIFASITVLFFILNQVDKVSNRGVGILGLEMASSVFYLIIIGMWNVCVYAMIFFYLPFC